MRAQILTVCTAATLAPVATAQPINLDLSDHYASPASTYGAAADQPGHWNVTNGQAIDLVDLEGAPSGVSLTFPMGSGGNFFIQDPFLEGDVHALLDDAFTTGDVVQGLHFENLDNGTYDVYAYGPPVNEITTFFIGNGNQSDSFNLPGGWNGDLEQGVNYNRVTVEVTEGTIDVQWVSGFFGGIGWITGVQLVPAGGCPADINGDGELNILDFVAFQNLFVAGDLGADCDGNGALNILDFVCFQGLFQAGCP